MPSYRGMPARTAALTFLIDRVRRQPIAQMSVDDIRATRAAVFPVHRPITWLTGRAHPDIRITTMAATARDGARLPLRVYRHPDHQAPGVVLWFHGGGFVLGNVANYDPICTAIAAGARAVVVSVDYRLAPEHRAPTAAHDCIDATDHVVAFAGDRGWDPTRIAVAGDSAGGNLAAVVAQVLRNRGASPLRAQALVYPATDLTMSSPSINEHPDGAILTKSDMDAFLAHYCPPGTDLRDPLLSPLFGRLDGLPPALIQTADLDPIRDDGVRYAAALTAAGVSTRHTNYAGVPHGFASMPGVSRQGRRQRGELVEFLGEHLA